MYLLAKPVSKVNKPIKIIPVLPPQKDDLNPKIFQQILSSINSDLMIIKVDVKWQNTKRNGFT